MVRKCLVNPYEDSIPLTTEETIQFMHGDRHELSPNAASKVLYSEVQEQVNPSPGPQIQEEDVHLLFRRVILYHGSALTNVFVLTPVTRHVRKNEGRTVFLRAPDHG
jgi:hypothetical protein